MGRVQVTVLSPQQPQQRVAPPPPSRLQRFAKSVGILIILIVLVVLVRKFVKVKALLRSVSAWIETHKVPGMVILPLLIWGTLPFGFPCSLFEIAAGSLFGIPIGAAMSVVGKTAGGVLAFLVGRYFLRAHFGSYLQTNFRAFRGMCEVLQSCDWKPLLLVQLSGLPNALKCYGLAITDVSLWRFTVTAFVGGIPHSLVWTLIGKQAQDLLASATTDSRPKKISTPQLLLLIGGILLTLLALVTLSCYTKKQMQKQQQRAKITAFASSPRKPVATVHAATICAVVRSTSETESTDSTDEQRPCANE